MCSCPRPAAKLSVLTTGSSPAIPEGSRKNIREERVWVRKTTEAGSGCGQRGRQGPQGRGDAAGPNRPPRSRADARGQAGAAPRREASECPGAQTPHAPALQDERVPLTATTTEPALHVHDGTAQRELARASATPTGQDATRCRAHGPAHAGGARCRPRRPRPPHSTPHLTPPRSAPPAGGFEASRSRTGFKG